LTVSKFAAVSLLWVLDSVSRAANFLFVYVKYMFIVFVIESKDEVIF
jgi:hypothetical protein